MTDKNVEGAESGTKVSEYDMTKMNKVKYFSTNSKRQDK
jgi:hypothetical protein